MQREGDVVHVVATRLFDLSHQLADLGERDAAFPLPHGRGDEFHRGGAPDPRDKPPPRVRARDIFIPDLHIDLVKERPLQKARNFR